MRIPGVMKIVFVVVFGWSSAALGAHGPVSLEAFINRSSVISVITIVGGHKFENSSPSCAYYYTVEIDDFIRGGMAWSGMISMAGLSLGRKYLVVSAPSLPWEKRSREDDVRRQDEKKEVSFPCTKAGAITISDLEVFPIVRNMATGKDWISTPPDLFEAGKHVKHVEGEGRVYIEGYDVKEPAPEVRDYFLLEDLLGIARKASED